MALKRLVKNIFTADDVIRASLVTYIQTTGDHNLTEHFDTTPFNPTFHASSYGVAVFAAPQRAHILLDINLLLPHDDQGSVLSLFIEKNIGDGFVFILDGRSDDSYQLYVYYETALSLLPPDFVYNLITFKLFVEGAAEKLLPGRLFIWKRLWQQKYKFLFTFHPTIFYLMTCFLGPIPLFLQQAQAVLTHTIGGEGVYHLVDTFVNIPWSLTRAASSRFLNLWHYIMLESTATYLPDAGTDPHNTSSIIITPDPPRWILNADKLLCLLLLFFNKPYREKLKLLLLNEEPPLFLRAIYQKYSVFQ